MKQKVVKTIKDYLLMTFATVLLVIGVYIFKFPNHFSFGGVTGIAVVLTAVMPVSATMLTNVINIALLVLGFAVLGRGFGIRTVYVTLLSTSRHVAYGAVLSHDRAFDLPTGAGADFCHYPACVQCGDSI